MLADAWSDREACTDNDCVKEAAALISQIENLPAYFSSGISLAGSIPSFNGSIVYSGLRNTKVLSQTTTEYIGGQTLVSTTQTDYNDCSRYLNFGYGAINPVQSFQDCRDNPTQMREYGYDPEHYQGFAFGMGIDRIAMLKHGLPDLRLLFENDVRFLEQFR